MHLQIHNKSNQQICEKCGKTFNTIYNLRRHEETEHSETKPQPEQCTICKTWYTTKAGLQLHMKTKHDDIDKEHRCHVCDKVFPSHRGLMRHVLIIHKSEYKYKCVMCDKAFKIPKQLKEHISVHTGERLYTCTFCPMSFACSANMYKHRQTLHKAEYAEIQRSKNKTTVKPTGGSSNTTTERDSSSSTGGEVQDSRLLVHTEMDMNYEMQTNTSIDSQIVATTHNGIFPYKRSLRHHMLIHNEKKRKMCEKCGKTFNMNYNMRRHEETQHSDVKHQCTMCPLWYKDSLSLKLHIQIKHDDVGKEHRCQFCDKILTSHRGLLSHINLVHKCKSEHKCHLCDKVFKRPKRLREHIAVHTGERLYPCPYCPMAFASSANMYKHRQTLHKTEYLADKEAKLLGNNKIHTSKVELQENILLVFPKTD